MLKGIYPPITTPFINGEISFEKLKFNIDKLNETNLSGYVALGSNGESAFLTFNEKVAFISKVKEFSSPDKILIAGTGSDSIKDTISLSNIAADEGADYVLVLTPSFYKNEMKHDQLLTYFQAVADSIKVPLIIYNVPKFTNVTIEPETVAALAQHKNVAGIKSSSEVITQIVEYVSMTENNFDVLVGTASIIYSGLCVGAKGGIVALANVLPNQCIDVIELYNKGKLGDSLALQNKLV
jgi:4-hydroxy-2-oxoglutarate aldolase